MDSTKITFMNSTQEVAVYFSAGGDSVNWDHSGGNDITSFDADTTRVEVRFWYIGRTLTKNRGIRFHLKAYRGVSTGLCDVNWDQVRRGLNAGKTVAQIVN